MWNLLSNASFEALPQKLFFAFMKVLFGYFPNMPVHLEPIFTMLAYNFCNFLFSFIGSYLICQILSLVIWIIDVFVGLSLFCSCSYPFLFIEVCFLLWLVLLVSAYSVDHLWRSLWHLLWRDPEGPRWGHFGPFQGRSLEFTSPAVPGAQGLPSPPLQP